MSQPVKPSHEIDAARPLPECLSSVDSDHGRQRVREYLKALPFPNYEPAPDSPGLLVCIDEDGTLGRFVGRESQAVR